MPFVLCCLFFVLIMNQHPVPQNISSYEFKLVGDMTLKQFFQLAGGAGIALLFYASPLPPLIKWPLVILFGSIGAALAFLPIQERPLSAWIFAFIKAVYSPTIYTFIPNQSEEVFRADAVWAQPEILMPQGENKAREYLSLVPQQGAVDGLEQNEKNFLRKISALFQTNHSSAPRPATDSVTPPAPVNLPIVENLTIAQVPTPARVVMQVIEEKDGLEVPQSDRPLFGPQETSSFSSRQATFASQAAPPMPPERPNTVVGQVLTSSGEIVAGAILEIKDTAQKPVRALRTNKVGHFMIVTPLQNGEYQIEVEKEGLVFEPVIFRVEGTIIQPILIKSTKG